MSLKTFELRNQSAWPLVPWPPIARLVDYRHATDYPHARALVYTRPDHVAEILRDSETFISRRTPFWQPSQALLDVEPPVHTNYRDILAPYFNQAAAQAILPTMRGFAAELFTANTGKFPPDLTYRYAAAVFLHAFGLPASDRPHIASMASRGAYASIDFGSNYVRRRLPDAAGGILAELRGQLDDEILIALGSLCLSGFQGLGDTAACTAKDIAARPQLRHQLQQHPDLIRATVEEMLRCFPASPLIPRTATQPTNIGGITLPPGSPVLAFVGAINREHGHTALADNKAYPHTTFGRHIHRCLGMHLARTALTAMIEQLVLT